MIYDATREVELIFTLTKAFGILLFIFACCQIVVLLTTNETGLSKNTITYKIKKNCILGLTGAAVSILAYVLSNYADRICSFINSHNQSAEPTGILSTIVAFCIAKFLYSLTKKPQQPDAQESGTRQEENRQNVNNT